MSRGRTAMRVTERSTFGPSVEWYELPIVGPKPARRIAPFALVGVAVGIAAVAGWLLLR